MDGRALAAAVGAAFQATLLAALIAGGVSVVDARAEETPYALTFRSPADTDQDAPSPASATAGEDQAPEIPATAPVGEDGP